MYSVIIPAAGNGTRLNLGYNKVFYNLSGKAIIEHTVNVFFNDIKCKQIIVTTTESDLPKMKKIFKTSNKVEFSIGGSSRQESIYKALKFVKENVTIIHDGSRPFLTQEMIDSCFSIANRGDGVTVGIKPNYTVKLIHPSDSSVLGTINRDELLSAQTPQAFPTAVIQKAHKLAVDRCFEGTDCLQLVEVHTEVPVKFVQGSYKNVKFTTPEDIDFFEFLMTKR